MSPGRRAVLLAACLAAGSALGACGYLYSGSQWWFVAIPAVIAGAWLALANPERCAGGSPTAARHEAQRRN